MKIQVTIGDNTHEVDLSSVQLPDGADIITPENASSKGYFTQAQLNAKAEEINKKKVERAKKDLRDDEDFRRDILMDYGIKLDENGKPTGLKPDFDPEEWKAKKAKELTKPLEEQLEKVDSDRKKLKDRLIEQSILSATKGAYKDEFTDYGDDGRVKPIVVNQYRDLFDIDDRGQVVLRDKDGEGFAIDGKGQHVTPDRYLLDKDKFGKYLKDTRQEGSNFQSGGNRNGKPVYSQKDIKKMSDDEYAKHRADILAATGEGRVN